MIALREMDEETGEGSLILDHVIHAMPPIEYNLDGTVKHTYAYGKPNDIDSRFRCFSNEKLGAHGVVGLDLSAANEFCGSEVQYAAKAKSSHLHNTLHEDQSKHGVVVAIPDGWSPAELVRSLWPNCEEMMTASMLFNDGRVDPSGCILEPETESVQSDAQGKPKGRKSKVPTAKGASSKGARSKEGTPVGACGLRYADTSGRPKCAAVLIARGFTPRPHGTYDKGGLDDFASDVDSSKPGAFDDTSGTNRLK